MATKRKAPKTTEFTAPKTVTFAGHRWKRTDASSWREVYVRNGWELEVTNDEDEDGPHDFRAKLQNDVRLGDGHEPGFEASVDHCASQAESLLALERLIGDACGRVG